jgi:hypothetical protein
VVISAAFAVKGALIVTISPIIKPKTAQHRDINTRLIVLVILITLVPPAQVVVAKVYATATCPNDVIRLKQKDFKTQFFINFHVIILKF